MPRRVPQHKTSLARPTHRVPVLINELERQSKNKAPQTATGTPADLPQIMPRSMVARRPTKESAPSLAIQEELVRALTHNCFTANGKFMRNQPSPTVISTGPGRLSENPRRKR
jgi:hypothetical protein